MAQGGAPPRGHAAAGASGERGDRHGGDRRVLAGQGVAAVVRTAGVAAGSRGGAERGHVQQHAAGVPEVAPVAARARHGGGDMSGRSAAGRGHVHHHRQRLREGRSMDAGLEARRGGEERRHCAQHGYRNLSNHTYQLKRDV